MLCQVLFDMDFSNLNTIEHLLFKLKGSLGTKQRGKNGVYQEYKITKRDYQKRAKSLQVVVTRLYDGLMSLQNYKVDFSFTNHESIYLISLRGSRHL